jgi:hypothetical protein
MPPYQRRHGQPVRVWKVVQQTDDRGNVHDVATPDDAHEIKAWVFAQRSARAEVPGQLGINVIRIGVSADLEGVDLWSKVEIDGKLWDVAAPPVYHQGTRHTRHWSLDLRERPNGNHKA